MRSCKFLWSFLYIFNLQILFPWFNQLWCLPYSLIIFEIVAWVYFFIKLLFTIFQIAFSYIVKFPYVFLNIKFLIFQIFYVIAEILVFFCNLGQCLNYLHLYFEHFSCIRTIFIFQFFSYLKFTIIVCHICFLNKFNFFNRSWYENWFIIIYLLWFLILFKFVEIFD